MTVVRTANYAITAGTAGMLHSAAEHAEAAQSVAMEQLLEQALRFIERAK